MYELFTGQLPFDSGDVLELIHEHIAQQPKPPHEIEPSIPGPLSNVVLKLLTKDADDRYQTARGVQADLARCLDQWQRNGRIEPFEPGGDDFTGRLRIPEKLYGRRAEVEHLQDVLDRAITEQAQLLLVAGYSGVGKTSLVREIQKDVTAKQGIYIEGKFDKLRRAQPYFAWEQAFNGLVTRWLAQNETSLAAWRDAVLDAVGDHGQVLIDIIPALERVLGPQPDVPQLEGVENRNRINYFFNRLIGCLATPEHPLIVFLDDLQWIDPASLNLIEALFALQSASRLLLIGAYRCNEVGATHPLAISQNRMQAETDQVTILTLGDLPPDAMNRLLAESLQLDTADCSDLCQILMEKSARNPLFFKQLLAALESKGFLKFDRPQGRWTWDVALSRKLPVGRNVVELMTETIRALSAETRHGLRTGACLGSWFAIDTLTTVTGLPRKDVLEALHPALEAGLLIRSNGRFSFTHDRIQEAAYALIPSADRPRLHLAIGRTLLAAIESGKLTEEIFSVVGHLNAGRMLIEADSEKQDLAALNLRAAQKARAASAFANAERHIEIGLALLGQCAWQDCYELALSLHTEKAELALILGRPDDVVATAELIHANARNTLDQVRAYKAQIEAEISRYETARALRIGLGVLEELGVVIPAKPDSSDVQRLNQKLLDLVTSTPLDFVAGLPAMTDVRALAASSILSAISSAAYTVNPPLVPIINYEAALLTAEFGHNTWSAVIYARQALVAFSEMRLDSPDDELRDLLALATQMRSISLELLKLPNMAPTRAKVLHILALIAHWIQPIDKALELAQAAYESGGKTGDPLSSTYGCLHTANHGLAAGLELDAYRRLLDEHMQFCIRTDQQSVRQWLSMFLQAVQRFDEMSPEPDRLIGAYFNEDDWLPGAEAAGDLPGRHWLYLFKLLLSYHFDIDSKLDEYVLRSEEFLAGVRGMVSVAVCYFYSALARLRLAGQLNEQDRAEALHLADDSLRLMRFWSETTPSTFQHKADLIAAEKARVVGDLEGSLSRYECAIRGARTSGFTHEEALANELYARFWAERGHDRFSGPLMREAHSLYLKWGAHAKADHLAKRYPDLMIGRSVVADQPGTRTVSGVIPGELDIRTVLKASQDIASEIELDSLLARLMADAIENTGAQRGFLILEREGRWMIEAGVSVDEPDICFRAASQDISGCDQLEEGIVRFVARTQETLVLDDASRYGGFVNRRYIQARRARSVLCAPLINQGNIAAILYLENNLAPGVFSHQRVSLLRLLSSQMAISIDNARIHADLESLLESRSKALASAEAQVRTLFENSPLGVALTNCEGRFLSVNKALLKMLGITEEELLEHSVIECYGEPSDRDALLRRVNESGFVQDFGVWLVRHDESRFYASLTVSKLVLEGNKVMLTMVQDVTAQITAEQETAVLEERARLARELHDAVSQTILSASLLADSTARAWEEGHGVSTEDLRRLSRLLRGALDEMRTLLFELRPAAVRDRTLGQLLAALVETMRTRSSAPVELETKGDHVLPEQVTMTLHRIAQESLNNAVRHASAKTIKIELVSDPDEVVLRIADDGQGFDADAHLAGHHGLDIMRERAEEIGGVLGIESRAGFGTRVTVTWS
jgi:PAS domain S-box-containing protein